MNTRIEIPTCVVALSSFDLCQQTYLGAVNIKTNDRGTITATFTNGRMLAQVTYIRENCPPCIDVNISAKVLAQFKKGCDVSFGDTLTSYQLVGGGVTSARFVVGDGGAFPDVNKVFPLHRSGEAPPYVSFDAMLCAKIMKYHKKYFTQRSGENKMAVLDLSIDKLASNGLGPIRFDGEWGDFQVTYLLMPCRR